MANELTVFEIIKGRMRYTVAAASEEIGAHLLGCNLEQFNTHGRILEDNNCERFKTALSSPESVLCKNLPKQNPHVFKKA
ncbi:hypothetical protein [Vibrio alginolyticus]|uniref:hypothetical protein n=1 Tax=Vibrio alginolyticus TaxID=663 RepID=UPI0006CAA5C1|nr:hypothetical protein [Vibrio alginolyticus]KPM98458.1 hypothetical protein AOG25_08415 [Vibrio alginolyticus]CAH7231535.1 conserved hypothetical protein [Vibrio chagasii]